jgi:uncharacterized membrane protein YfcA
VSTAVAVAAVAVAVGSLVQSATGFGFALLAAPVTTAALGPVESVPTITIAGLVVSGLVLAGEGRRPAVVRRAAWVLTLASIPGMALGAAILARAPEDALRVLVAVVVIVSAVAVVRSRERPEHTHRGGGVVAGLVGGVLSTTSGVNGPPLLAHLRTIGAGAVEVRDTLAVVFLVSGVLALVALIVAGTLEVPSGIALIAAAAVVGQVGGRVLFAALENHREAATRTVLAMSVAAAVVPAVQALAG